MGDGGGRLLTERFSAPHEVRALADFHAGSRDGVLSLYLDLDPSEFAVPKARTAEIESLADQARQRYTDDEEHRPLELDSPVARTVERVLGVHLMEFGIPEAMWHIRVKDFAAIVTMDAHGNSLHAGVEEQTGKALEALQSVGFADPR